MHFDSEYLSVGFENEESRRLRYISVRSSGTVIKTNRAANHHWQPFTLVCYEKFERIETSQFHNCFVLLNMIFIEKA